MIVVLTVLTVVSGGLLAAVQSGTELQIENQVLKFQKAPAIKDIFPDATNDPLAERFTVKAEDIELLDSKPGEVRANAYDLVINGTEIGEKF